MLNTEEYKLFIQNNCLQCKRYKRDSEDNCGTNKKIEVSQYLEGTAAEVMFPSKDIPQIEKYICKKLNGKEVKKINKVADNTQQIKMF
jgi:hypothetical protein